MSASPASIIAANAIIALGMLKGHKITSADAVKAYLQGLLNSLAETWLRLPKEVLPESWFDKNGRPLFTRPVIKLLRSLYMAIQRLALIWSASLSRNYLTWAQSRSQNFRAHTHSSLMEISP